MRMFLLLTAAIIVLSSPVPVCGETGSDSVAITYIVGAPSIIKAGDNEAKPCAVGMEISNGDRINTGSGEDVEISFGKKGLNVVRVEENSDVFIRKKTEPCSIELLNGSAMAYLRALPKNSTFEIRTPAGLSGARGTGWRSVTNGQTTIFSAFEHYIYAQGIGQDGSAIGDAISIYSGWKTLIEKFEKAEKLEKLTQAELARWNDWKQDLLNRLQGQERSGMNRADRVNKNIERIEAQKDVVNDLREMDRIEKRLDSGGGGGSSSGGGGDQEERMHYAE